MQKAQNDVSLSLALLCLVAVVSSYFYLTYFRSNPAQLLALINQTRAYAPFWWATAFSGMLNVAVITTFIKRKIGLEGQGSKLKVLGGEKQISRADYVLLISLFLSASLCFAIHKGIAIRASDFLAGYMVESTLRWITYALSVNLSVPFFFVLVRTIRFLLQLKMKLFEKSLKTPSLKNGEIILGTTVGELSHEAFGTDEAWVKIPARGVNGGIFISGSIGSGKTQGTVLPYLRQIANSTKNMPTMLAIDPKGTFLKEAEKILVQAGHGDRILKFSLANNISFNPVYGENLLKNANFLSMAEMVRAAAVNFMGKATDSPFWDFSSATLIRNVIVYCAATLGYFTLLDVYRTIVNATTSDLAVDLRNELEKKSFTAEERFNIERAIEYFNNEYSQLEDRVRTGIVATSTAFINQFQEFSASRIFCPKESDLTIRSMEDLVKEGKIILFDVQRPGLARSMGTFIKLHFEQAILNQINTLRDKGMPISSILLIDEYQDVATCGGGGTLGDESFIAKARESKPAVIVATQSVSSLINTVGSQRSALELIQNFRTRIACHSTDMETINLFKDLAGKADIETKTHSISETSQSAKRNLLIGGFDSANSNLNESISQGERREDLVTGKEFSRLKTFEAFAHVFDGVETKFLKLYLKPDYIKNVNTRHKSVLETLKVKSPSRLRYLFERGRNFLQAASVVMFSVSGFGSIIPNICTIAKTPEFNSCLDLSVSACTCGFPPHPCASISYYVPQTYIEVWPEAKTSYFTAIPGAGLQLAKALPLPFGAEGDDDTQSFHARTIVVPLASLVFKTMPAMGTRMEKLCFDGMSEHFEGHWNTGKSDLLQPLFLAWSASPKACLLKGAMTSISGDSGGAPQSDSMMCSVPLPKLELFPPSNHPACNGWGTFYPRYGTYNGPASMAGALMIASRIKSLSSEVLKSMPNNPDEKWQMIYPQSSSCFREGQNIGALETIKGVRETMRLSNGKLKGYLFVIWSKTSTCQELPSAVQAKAASLAIPAACGGF